MQPGYFLKRQSTLGDDECIAIEDEWLVVQANEDEISLFEKLCQSEFIMDAVYLISGQESQVSFHLNAQKGEAKRKEETS